MLKRVLFVLIIISLVPDSMFGQKPDNREIIPAPNGNIITTRFHATDSVFPNPGQGWMSSRFPSTIRYIRLGWVDFEPERGKYDWSKIDDAVSSARKRGGKIAIRIMTCSPHSSGYYTSPKWLFDEGCKFHEYLAGGDDPTSGGARITRIEPDYSDPVYLERHAEFITALGEKYDESSDIEFLDIGSYGYWGEWHTPNPAPLSDRKKIVDMYIKAFKKTPLVFMTDDAEVLAYAIDKGTGIRRDGVGSRWHEQNWIGSAKYSGVKGMADVWKNHPVVFEWYGNYDYLLQRGWSFDSAVNFMLKNHVTIINDNIGKVPPDKMPQIETLSRLAGARFVLNEISHARSATVNSTVPVKMKWTNAGAGKLYRQAVLRLYLLDSGNRVISKSDSKTDPASWLPGEFENDESIQIPASAVKGVYKLAVGLVIKDPDQSSFHLAIDVPEINGMYILDNLEIH